MRRVIGVLLLVLMVVHVCLRPQGIWVLGSTCDIAAVATAIGLITYQHRLVASAFLFQLGVGFPSLVIGMLTTYDTNVTGVAVHVVPLVIGGAMVRREGLPRGSLLIAWAVYAASIVFAYAVAPPALHVNFTDAVWPPLAKSISLPVFHALLFAIVGVLLSLAWLGARKLLVRR